MKTIQFFIGSTGVEEVKITSNNKFVCTCDGFINRKKCKHITWIELQFEKDTFPMQIDKATPDEAIKKARESNEAFREFLLRYGKIEVV